MHIQYQKPNLFREEIESHIVPVIPGHPSTESATIVSDGKTAWKYLRDRKMFLKLPVPAKLPLAMMLQIPNPLKPTARFGSPAHGMPANHYLVEMPMDPSRLSPKIPAAERAKIVKDSKPFQVEVEKSTMHVVRWSVAIPGRSLSLDIADQKFNVPMARGVFQFTPPPGAKEAQAPPNMPPGGSVPLPPPPPAHR